MPPALKPDSYHVVAFQHLTDAAAFIAALSRFLASPAGSALRAHETPVEIWITHEEIGAPVALYLSPAALRATASGFGSPTVIALRTVGELPLERILVFGDGDRGAYGVDDIMLRITSAA